MNRDDSGSSKLTWHDWRNSRWRHDRRRDWGWHETYAEGKDPKESERNCLSCTEDFNSYERGSIALKKSFTL